MYVVSHTGLSGQKLTAHKTLMHARDSVRKRLRKPYQPSTGAVIYAVAPQDLHEVEQHGKVETVIEGQEALF